MAEVLLAYRRVCLGGDAHPYAARACGGEARDGTNRWQGWLEFWPLRGGAVVKTARETTQPNRTCLVYWATGLGSTYLEGALGRAMPSPSDQPAASGGSVTAAVISQPPVGPVCLWRLALTPWDRRFLKSLGIRY